MEKYKNHGQTSCSSYLTYNPRSFLCDLDARTYLKQVWTTVRQQRPFDVVAVCLLPDHLHCVWKLPDNDDDYSMRWALIKKNFTQAYIKNGGTEVFQSGSRINKRERGIWQRRFWEHKIRDGGDLQRHIDYIHFNPVKHGLVENIEEWPYSSYHKYVESGRYANEYFTGMQKRFDGIFAGE
jgi:putative transposase